MSYTNATTYCPHAGSLPDKVLNFFMACQDEELTSIDIAEKFGVAPSGSVSQKMAPLVHMGLLVSVRRGRFAHYLAGPQLALWKSGLPTYRVNAAPAAVPVSVQVSPVAPLRPAANPTPPAPLEIRINLQVHGLGTPEQRIEVMGVEP